MRWGMHGEGGPWRLVCHYVAIAFHGWTCALCALSVGGPWFGFLFLVVAVPYPQCVGGGTGATLGTYVATILSLRLMSDHVRSVRWVMAVHGLVFWFWFWRCLCPMRWWRQGEGDPWRLFCHYFATAFHG